MIKNQELTLITRHMDRLKYLKRTLPTWLSIDEIDNIIIVEWSSKKDRIIDYINEINNPKITVLEIKGQKFFNSAKCWNVGIRFCSSENIALIDSDIMFKKNPFSFVDIKDSKKFYTFKPIIGRFPDCVTGNASETGSCIIKKSQWKSVNGFFEKHIGWGGEDLIFYTNMMKKGYIPYNLGLSFVEHIHHDDELRFNNQERGGNCYSINKTIAKKLRYSAMEQYMCSIHNYGKIEEKMV